MANPNVLGAAQLAQAQQSLNQGGPTAMYSYLASNGYNYATLANGVVLGNTLSGAYATRSSFVASASK